VKSLEFKKSLGCGALKTSGIHQIPIAKKSRYRATSKSWEVLHDLQPSLLSLRFLCTNGFDRERLPAYFAGFRVGRQNLVPFAGGRRVVAPQKRLPRRQSYVGSIR